jgi:flavocytochrome c
MEITYALMQKYDQICEKQPDRARLFVRARSHKLITDNSGAVVGVVYEMDGKNHEEYGVVVIATGGYAAGGLTPGSFMSKYRPDLMNLPTTNGTHCTGDGIVMGMEVGGVGVDLEWVQVHPTGLVHRDMPDERVKFLAAEALRGVGGLLLDQFGNRFCNELGTRDYVSGEMFKNKGPFYLILNSKAYEQILWHCKHYTGRKVMQFFTNGADMAKDLKVTPAHLKATFEKYNKASKDGCPFGRKFFEGVPWHMDDTFYCAIVTPVVHYSMGGIGINENGAVIRENKQPIPGLFAAGEVTGGVHGKNRLGGSALLECLVYGRVSGASAAKYAKTVGPRAGIPSGGAAVTITVPQADGSVVTISVSGSGGVSSGSSKPSSSSSSSAAASAPASKSEASAPAKKEDTKEGGTAGEKTYTLEEIASHNTEKDCWVAVNGLVLNVTDFLNDHPGGKMAIMTFAGRDATEEFNMVHDKNVIDKYAKQYIIGKLAAGKSKL